MTSRISGIVHAEWTRDKAASNVLLALLFLMAAPLAVVTHLGIAPLLIIAGAAGLVLNSRAVVSATALRPLAFMLLALSLWAAASSLWSIAPEQTRGEIWKLLAVEISGISLLAVATALGSGARRQILYFAAGGVCAAAAGLMALTVLNQMSPFPLNDYVNGATVIALFVWPIAIGLMAASRRWAGALLVVFVAIAVASMGNQAARLAMAVGVLTTPAALLFPRMVAAVIALGTIGMTFMMPLAPFSASFITEVHEMAPWIENSGIHRLIIWGFTNDQIAARPFLGWGFDAAHYLPSTPALENMPDLPGPVPEGFSKVPHHPHNAALQWRVELGLPGAVLCLSIILWTLWRICISNWSRGSRASALAAMASAMTVASLSYGAWQTWWMSCIWLVAVLTVVCGRPLIQRE